MLSDLARIQQIVGSSPSELRDTAILLVGFFGALRRSEIVQIRRADVTISEERVTLHIRRSKTDQLAHGRTVHLPVRHDLLCPKAALEAWLEATAAGNYVFEGTRNRPLDPRTVARIVKRWAGKAGLDARLYSGHSLRAGFVTSAAVAGWNSALIARQTGHRSVQVLASYVRPS